MTASERGNPGKAVSLPVYGSDDCQLMTLEAAGTEFTVAPRITPAYLVGAAFRALVRPDQVVRKLGRIAHRRRANAEKATPPETQPVSLAPLHLEPGALVRVKSKEAIRATLDADNRYERLAYMDVVMDRYCGRTLRVRNRVERFFDERNWRMMKLKNVVILEDTYCQPAVSDPVPWAGCQRSCFLFWKEAWLEPLEESAR